MHPPDTYRSRFAACKRFPVLGACALIWLSAISGAQELAPSQKITNTMPLEPSLDQLVDVQVDSVFGASKYLQKVTSAPAAVSIVTAEDIKNFGYRNLADVLRGVRGLYVTYDRNYSNFG